MGTPGGAGGRGTLEECAWPTGETCGLAEGMVTKTSIANYVVPPPRQAGAGVAEDAVNASEETIVTARPMSLKGIWRGVDDLHEVVRNSTSTRRSYYDKVGLSILLI